MRLGLFASGLIWLVVAHRLAVDSSSGIATRLNLPSFQPLLSDGFFLFLLVVGFAVLRWLATRRDGGFAAVSLLPRRSTRAEEWVLGAEVGWAALLLAVLPMLLAGDLHPSFWWQPRAWGLTLLSLVALLVAALATEVAFRGWLFKQLIAAIGPTGATLLMSAVYALLASVRPHATGRSLLLTFLAGLLFSLAYLRTHALWLGWGLHFGWLASMAVIFGLPVGGLAIYSGVVETDVSGHRWLTGSAYGPEGAWLTGVVYLLAAFAVYRVSREFAWIYTHPEIVAAGYPMEVPPPAAHTAMQAEAPKPLVQIGGMTPLASAPPQPERPRQPPIDLDPSDGSA